MLYLGYETLPIQAAEWQRLRHNLLFENAPDLVLDHLGLEGREPGQIERIDQLAMNTNLQILKQSIRIDALAATFRGKPAVFSVPVTARFTGGQIKGRTCFHNKSSLSCRKKLGLQALCS